MFCTAKKKRWVAVAEASQSSAVAQLDAQIREKDKAARELEAQAQTIGAGVFDLKTVNPNVVAVADDRTPAQIIQNIQDQGRIVADALARLNALLASG